MLEKGGLPNTAEAPAGSNFAMKDLTYTKSGLPLIPDAVRNEFGTETKRIQQAILRVYLSKHYSNVVLNSSRLTLIECSVRYRER